MSLRAYLQIMSWAGVIYSAQCEEKVLRAYVTTAVATEVQFVNQTKKRLCTEFPHDMLASQDDKALL